MVGRAGIEPATICLKGSCSTAELPAHTCYILRGMMRSVKFQDRISARALQERKQVWEQLEVLRYFLE